METIQKPRSGITRHSALERKVEALTEVVEKAMDEIAGLSKAVVRLADLLDSRNDELADEIEAGERAVANAVGVAYRTPAGNGDRL